MIGIIQGRPKDPPDRGVTSAWSREDVSGRAGSLKIKTSLAGNAEPQRSAGIYIYIAEKRGSSGGDGGGSGGGAEKKNHEYRIEIAVLPMRSRLAPP